MSQACGNTCNIFFPLGDDPNQAAPTCTCTQQMNTYLQSGKDVHNQPQSDGVMWVAPVAGDDTTQWIMGSGEAYFDSIYQGTPFTTDGTEINPSGYGPNIWGYGSTPYGMYVNGDQKVVVNGPFNQTSKANYISKVANTITLGATNYQGPNITYPPWGNGNLGACPSPTCQASDPGPNTWYNAWNADRWSPTAAQYRQNYDSMYQVLSNGAWSSRAQDWMYMLHQSNYTGQNFGGTSSALSPNVSGTYAMKTGKIELPSSTYDPGQVTGQQLQQACRVVNKLPLAPSYSFAGYCMKDIVFPDAFDHTQSITIPCPTFQAKDASGKPVTVPGVVCIQGNDTDTSQMGETVTQIGTGANGTSHGVSESAWTFWETADLAPACLDVQVNGKEPVFTMGNGDTITNAHQTIFDGLEPITTIGGGGFYSPQHCLPQNTSGGMQEENNGPGMSGLVPGCFNDPPSGTTYGNVLMKNVCLTQQPFDRWGSFASLNNTQALKPDPITYNNGLTTTGYNAPGSGKNVSPADTLKRHWMTKQLNTAANNASGPNNIGGGDIGMGAFFADGNGQMVSPQATGGATFNAEKAYFWGYQPRNGLLFEDTGISNMWSDDTLYLGIGPHADYTSWYNQQGLMSFRGNFGAVPGMADNVSSVGWQMPTADPPTYLQQDMVGWTMPQ